jgi:Histidine phosphatase superfamily (branch 2)
MMEGIFWLFICLATNVAMVSSQSAEPQLVQITEIVRHGARNIIKSILGTKFPADIEPSRLTPNGHRMHYNLGVTLRKKYPEIFTTKTTIQQINLYSSPVHRCQQSAASQLMGLYPTGLYDLNITVSPQSPMVLADFEGTQNELDGDWALPNGYAPFPIVSNSDFIDNLFMPVDDACPVFFKNVNADKAKLLKQQMDLAKSVTDSLIQAGFHPKKLMGKDSFSFDDLAWIFDEVFAYRNFYDKLPDGITQELYEKLDRLANVQFIAMFGETGKYAKVHVDRMAKDLLLGMKQWVDGKHNHPTKFRLYSGHDTNVLAWTIGLGLTSYSCQVERARGKTPLGSCVDIPKFASSLIFELRRNNDTQEYFVKPLLNGKVIQICPSQKDSATSLCKFAEFEKVIVDNLTWQGDDYLTQCGNKMLIVQKNGLPEPTPTEKPKPELSLLGKIALLVCVLLAIAVLIICICPRSTIPSVKNSANDSETDSYRLKASINEGERSKGY